MEMRPFRAREPQWDVLEDSSGAAGVPRVLPKSLTSPKAFAFKSEARIEARRAAKQKQQKDETTRPQKRTQRQQNHRPNRTAPAEPTLTTPASPHFSIEDLSTTRAQQRAERAERRALAEEQKARLKREKEEQAEQEIADAYEKNRFRFKPPGVRSCPWL